MAQNPSRQPRKFEYKPAVRTTVPLLIGINSPSSAGKTYSALRIATGIQRVVGGDIAGIDSEANRMLHYAPPPGQKANPERGTFDFRHIPFGPPFGPLDYLDVIRHAVDKGARTIIVDSGSHMHEGPGGILEMHADEMEAQRERKRDRQGEDEGGANSFTAWNKPKSQLRQFITELTTGFGRPDVVLNIIFCNRAKQKLKIPKTGSKKPIELGLQPIVDADLRYEMTTNILLYDGADGVPTWTSPIEGEMNVIKLPKQFRDMFGARSQLSEEIGEKMALWAVGGSAPKGGVTAQVAKITADWVAFLEKRQISAQQILARLGKASVDHIDEQDHTALRALQERIKAKELTYQQAFAVSTPAPDDDEPGPGDDEDDDRKAAAPTPEEIARMDAAQGKTNGSAAAPRGEG